MAESTKVISLTIPVQTSILNDGKLSLTWQRFFKCISDYINQGAIPQSTIVSSGISLTYLLNGALCNVSTTLKETLAEDTVVKLPFISALAFEAFGTVYDIGASEITVPAGTQHIIFHYVIRN